VPLGVEELNIVPRGSCIPTGCGGKYTSLCQERLLRRRCWLSSEERVCNSEALVQTDQLNQLQLGRVCRMTLLPPRIYCNLLY